MTVDGLDWRELAVAVGSWLVGVVQTVLWPKLAAWLRRRK